MKIKENIPIVKFLPMQRHTSKAKYTFLVMTFLLCTLGSMAQDGEIGTLVDSVYNLLRRVKSYSAEATIHVDVEFINMPDKIAIVRFEAPDKYDIESDGFLMIPKVGMKPMMDQLDLNKYQLVDRGNEEINGVAHIVINMIPLSRKSQVVLSTIWINPEKYLISRIQTFTKKAGSFVVDLQYDGEVLPSQLTISFEVEGMNIPMKYFGNETEVDKKAFRQAETNAGVVSVRFRYTEIGLMDPDDTVRM
jgi:outer membrane lipoprotein-sorting protein